MTKKKDPFKASFLVVGTARNCSDTLIKDIHIIRKALSFSSSISFFIVESDSSDDTNVKLEKCKKEFPNFLYKSFGNIKTKYPLRTERIAFCRNKYLEEIKSNKNFINIDYVCVVDFDGVNNLLDKKGILSCWQRTDWDVCCACQKGPYYDVFALRQEFLSPNDCWEQRDFLMKQGFSKFRATYNSVYSRMLNYSKFKNWIKVDSAFGGFALYTIDSIKKGIYVGKKNNHKEICEHISLNKSIIDTGGFIYINPFLINNKRTTHSRFASLFGLFKFLIFCILEEKKFFKKFFFNQK